MSRICTDISSLAEPLTAVSVAYWWSKKHYGVQWRANSISVELSGIDAVLFWVVVLTFGWLSWAIAIDVSPIAKFHSCYFSYQSIQHSSRLQQSQWSIQSNFKLHLHLLQLQLWLFISHSYDISFKLIIHIIIYALIVKVGLIVHRVNATRYFSKDGKSLVRSSDLLFCNVLYS